MAPDKPIRPSTFVPERKPEASLSDLSCPPCGIAGLTVAAKRVYRTDCKCGGCGLAFSVSRNGRAAIRTGQSARLVEMAARVWLRLAANPRLRAGSGDSGRRLGDARSYSCTA